MSSQASLSLRSCQQSQRIHAERASTLPRTKPRTYSALVFSGKPSVSVLPASKPNSSPTLKPEASVCHHLSPPPQQQQLHPKPSVSPTLTVPAPRLSPSPTSMCQGQQQQQQPSSAAKERRAKSITISNTQVEPRQSVSNEAKHGILDQEALLDFTRSKSSRSSQLGELSPHQTHPDSQKQAATSQDFGFLQRKVSKELTPQRSLEFPAAAKPKSNDERLPSGSARTFLSSGSDGIKSADVVRGDAQSPFDGAAAHRSRSNTQTAGAASNNNNNKSFEQMCLERSAASRTSFPTVSPITKTRRRQLRQHDDAKVAATVPSCFNLRRHEEENYSPTSPHHHRFWSKAQSRAAHADVCGSERQSGSFSRDYSSPPRDAETCKRRGDGGFRTCLVLPQMQEASQKHLPPHKDVNVADVEWLRQADVFAAAERHSGLTECPSFSPNSSGISLKGVFDSSPSQPQSRLYQRPKEEASASRAVIMEQAEDPYYVTMYYPGSVYVDMSDIVPPEVRPKPAVPAKPSNVGAPSPSNPFPPQGPGFGGGSSVSAPPPSGIPVPIGSHGLGHGGGGGHGGVGHGGGDVGHAGPGGGSTLLGYIGIDTIIEQMRKKTMKTGFDFNIMVVGHSGLGKSTLVNTLFKSQVSRKSAGWSRDDKIPKTVEIKSVSHVIEEGGVKMKLTVVDTPGFGDQINNDNCWEPICKYINEQYEKFLKEEVNITRKKRIPDTRVHCCLYFISPTGHSLRQLDLEFMKRLSHSVNIIPIIAKADTMTVDERQEFKQRVRKEMEMSGIEFYPQKEFDEDMEDKSDNDKIREVMPFAVVGSNKEYQVNGKRVLGRNTAWGVVEVENPNHCEFAQLRDFLIRSHLQDLKEVTHNIHYETYRAKRLNENGGLHPISSNDTQESNL